MQVIHLLTILMFAGEIFFVWLSLLPKILHYEKGTDYTKSNQSSDNRKGND